MCFDLNNIPDTSHHFALSHLLSKRKLEGLQVEDDGRRVVSRKEHRVSPHAFQKTSEEILNLRLGLLQDHHCKDYPVCGILPLVVNDWVNLAAVLQLSCRGCYTFLHEQQQRLMGLLLHCCPYWHERAQRDEICLGYTCQLLCRVK